MSLAIGIDLGTTNSAIATLDEHGRPQILLNDLNASTTPSVLCFREGEILVGQEAKELQELGLFPVAAFFKRQMGNPNFVVHAEGKDYSAIDLSALVLEKLKRDAEARLGRAIESAVITVPAYFRDPERKATLEAGEKAGLRVQQVINEPTAAAVAYGLDQREEGERRLLVYDLGGGTFDVTVLKLDPEGIRVLTSDGDHQLGGKDWDDRLLQYLGGRFEDEFGSDPLAEAESFADLLVRVETAKRQLSERQKTTLSITHDGERGSYELSRELFEELTQDLVARTQMLTRSALDDVGLAPEAIDGVLLVGGATRMPRVHHLIEEMFGRPPLAGVRVDEAVALGAALTSAALAEPQKKIFGLGGPTRDVTNHSLGMIAVNSDRSAYVNSIILPKNRLVPCRETRPFQHWTRATGSRVEIFVTQGESESPADVTYLGCYAIDDLPHRAGGPTVVEIEYRYSQSATVEVSGSVEGRPLEVQVEALPPDVPERFLGAPKVSDAPRHLKAYLAFDLSGSMRGRPLEEAQRAAKKFVTGLDLACSSIGVIAFSDSVDVKLEASQNARRVDAALEGLKCGETGYGNLGHPFDSISKCFEGVEGTRFAIVLADGVWSNQERAIRAAQRCHSQGIEIIAIGFGKADRRFLEKIASCEESSFFTTMDGLEETYSTIAQVLTGGGERALRPRDSNEDKPAAPPRFGRLLERLRKL